MAKKVLGRGLNALFGSRKTEKPAEKAVLSEKDKKEEKSNALPDSDSVILKEESAVISEKKEEVSVKDNVVLSEKNDEKKESGSENGDSASKNNGLAVKNEKVIEGKTKDIIFSDEKKAADDSKNKKEENPAEKPSEKPATEITDGFLKINEKAMSRQEDDNKEQPKQEKVIRIPIERIRPNMYQPRRNFNETALQELAESIKSSGLLQPITVWKDPDREYYEIIAGERRTKAAKMAGLREIDAIVKENLSDDKKLELALIENIQREDLNAIDTAMAYQQLISHFGISQAEISRTVGKSRAAISNTLRLMELEENIRNSVRSGLISEGHARALLSIPDKPKRQEIFQRIITERLSVREAEAIAQNYHYELPVDNVPSNRRMSARTPEIMEIQSVLSRHFGSKVEIRPGSNGKKGKIVISYYSVDDFERITSILQK